LIFLIEKYICQNAEVTTQPQTQNMSNSEFN